MLNIVYDQDNPNTDQIMARVAEIDGKFYPYTFSLKTAQITVSHSNEFAKHSAGGVRAICNGYDKLEDAINQLPYWGRPVFLRAGY